MSVLGPGVDSDAGSRLTARLHPDARRVLSEQGDLLDDLSHAVGGPYHLLFPSRFDENAARFRQALAERGVQGRVCYAKKANKAAAWVERCADLGIGVDVSSAGELAASLAGGVVGGDVTVTGPAKSAALLRLAALHRCLTTIDDLEELERFIAVAGAHRGGRILLRCLPPCQPESRFGLTPAELGAAMKRCRAASASVRLEGFSFHLSGYDVQDRADTIASLVEHCRAARGLGLPVAVVCIGGGFTVDYVAAAPGSQGDGGALRFHAGRTFGGFYPYRSPVAGAAMLGAVLDAVPAGGQEPVAALLRRHEITLLVEPGRSLLDQAGLSVFRVQGVKERAYGIITVDGTSLSLSEQWFNSEFLPDPVLVGRGGGGGEPDEPFAACVGGATCLEVDMLSWRMIAFPRRPRVGDLLVYVNTAGYQMDSNESRFHELPLPPKLVLEEHGGRPRWRFDRCPR